MDSQDTLQDELQLNNLEQKDYQPDCTSNCENDIVIISTNGGIDLQPSSNSQPLSDSNLQSCMDVTESDSVNPVVTPVLQLPLQNVVSSQDSKDLPSAIINTTSVTTVNCHEQYTDSYVLMDASSSDCAVLGSYIPESSSLCSVAGSSTCSNAEEIDTCVDTSHEVQLSDLGTSSDTHKFKCDSQKLQLNPVCLQAGEPVNVISGCGDGEINSSIDDCSISQMPAECLEADKERGDKLIECDEVRISSSTDDRGVSQLPSECDQTNQEHSNVMNENDSIIGNSVNDSSVSQLPSECDQTNQEHSNVMNGNDSIIGNGVDDSSVSVEIKQEPFDLEYERSDLIYRSGAIVVDSDDDTSSTMFSGQDAEDSDNDVVAIEEEVVEQPPKVTVSKSYKILRTDGEVLPEELPPLEYLTISPDASVVLETLGIVSSIVGVLVIVKANISSPALFDDTVLFLDGRQPLGLIFEVFGTVQQPYYSVRFNTKEDIKDKGIVAGDPVFFAPKADNLTKYVFIAELRKIKCDDASWENDNEPPPSHRDYSDDEAERRARQQQRNKDRGLGETPETSVRRKKRRKRPSSGSEKDPHRPQLLQGDLNRNPVRNRNQTFNNSSSKPRWPHSVDPHRPQLLQGDLNRNPFGNKNQTFNNLPSKPRWPHSVGLLSPPPPPSVRAPPPPPPSGQMQEQPSSQWMQQPQIGNGQSPNNRPRFSPQSAQQPPPTFSGAFRNPWPPQANFAERPGWNQNQKAGLLGSVPNATMSGSPNTGHFTSNFSSRQPHPGFGNPPFPPPAGHNSHGPSPHLPQNSMHSQPNRFETFFPQGNMGNVNTFAPPPMSQPHSHRPPGFPMFSPSLPPPVVNAMFNQRWPTPPH